MPDLRDLQPGDDVAIVYRSFGVKKGVVLATIERVTPKRIFAHHALWHRITGRRVSTSGACSARLEVPTDEHRSAAAGALKGRG